MKPVCWTLSRLDVQRTVVQVFSPSRSMFFFNRVDIFDPVASLRSGVIVATIATILSALLGSPYAYVVLIVSVLSFYKISKIDQKRSACVSLHIQDPDLQSISIDDKEVAAELWVPSGTVARLNRNLRRVDPRPTTPGQRTLPLMLVKDSHNSAWVENNRATILSLEELRGALSVVLKGDDLQLELLYGSRTGTPPKVLGVCIKSTEGCLQTWDSSIQPKDSRLLTVVR